MANRPPNINDVLQIHKFLGSQGTGVNKQEYLNNETRLAKLGEKSYRQETLVDVERTLIKGDKVTQRIKNARYNWLFDDLQQFESMDFQDFETEKELEETLKEILPQKMRQESVKELAKNLYLVAKLRNERGVSKEQPLVQRLTPERTRLLTRKLSDKNRKQAFIASTRENLFKVFNEKKNDFEYILQQGRSKKGKPLYRELTTKQFRSNPLLQLKK